MKPLQAKIKGKLEFFSVKKMGAFERLLFLFIAFLTRTWFQEG